MAKYDNCFYQYALKSSSAKYNQYKNMTLEWILYRWCMVDLMNQLTQSCNELLVS